MRPSSHAASCPAVGCEETVGGRIRRSYGLTENGSTMLRAEAQRMAEAARLVTDAPTKATRTGLPSRAGHPGPDRWRRPRPRRTEPPPQHDR